MDKNQLIKQLEGVQDKIFELREQELELLKELAQLDPIYKPQYEWLLEDLDLKEN